MVTCTRNILREKGISTENLSKEGRKGGKMMGTMSLMSQESTKISVAMEFAFGQIVILTLRIGENAGDRAVL